MPGGWQVATHSNGDREIDMVLTAIERAEQRTLVPMLAGGLSMRVSCNQALLDRAKKDGVVLVFHSYMWAVRKYPCLLRATASLDDARVCTAIDMGIPVAGHSDSPISAAGSFA